MEDEVPDLGTDLIEDARPVVRDAGEENYSARVNKRVNGLLSRAKSAESRTERAESRTAELEAEIRHLRTSRLVVDEDMLKSRAADTERALRHAKETGDLDAEMKAHREMVALEVSADRVRIAKSAAEHEPASRQAAQQPRASDATQAWIDQNSDWFKKDDAMTSAAVAFDKAATKSGLAVDSPEYFAFIDKKMRASFSEHFEDEDESEVEAPEPARHARPAVAAPSRRVTAPATPRTSGNVRLSAEQMEAAKACGMTPQEYAANLPAK